MKITVIDYGLSNLRSVQNAFARCGAETLLTSSAADVRAAEALVLPGVGAFRDGMAGLERLGLVEVIRQKAVEGTPLLGICLGMQMLFDESEEFGTCPGLGLIPGRVVKIPAEDVQGKPQKVPHIRWDPLLPAGRYPLRRARRLCGRRPWLCSGVPVPPRKIRPGGPFYSQSIYKHLSKISLCPASRPTRGVAFCAVIGYNAFCMNV